MPTFIGHHRTRSSEWHKANEVSAGLLSALETIEGSLWLIAGGRIPLALLLLQTSIELAFKAELERIHPILTADIKSLDYKALKSLVKIEFLKHPMGAAQSVQDFDVAKTISFEASMNRVQDLYPSIASWNDRLKKSYEFRNAITHHGSEAARITDYSKTIATILLPFMDFFFNEIGSLSLRAIVTEPVYKQILVAKGVAERLDREGTPTGSYVLKTIGHQLLYMNVDWPKSSDVTGLDDGDQDFQLAQNLRMFLEKEWGGNFINTSCRICDSCDLFVRVEVHANQLVILAAQCPHCGLRINEEEKYLAAFHIGDLSEEEKQGFLADLH